MVYCNNRKCEYCTAELKCAWDLAGKDVSIVDHWCMSYRKRSESVRVTDLMRAPFDSNCHATQRGFKSNRNGKCLR